MTIKEAMVHIDTLGKYTGNYTPDGEVDPVILPDDDSDNFIERLVFALHVDVINLSDDELSEALTIALEGSQWDGAVVVQSDYFQADYADPNEGTFDEDPTDSASFHEDKAGVGYRVKLEIGIDGSPTTLYWCRLNRE